MILSRQSPRKLHSFQPVFAGRSGIRHVVFDWSGTLYDDHVPSFAATRKTVKEFSGKLISYAEYKKHFVIPVDKFYRRYDKRTPIAEIDRFYFESFANHIAEGRLFTGVLEALETLKRHGIAVSMFSTVRQDLLEGMCAKLGIARYFKLVRGSVFDKRKEFRFHLKELGAKASEVLFVGDMVHDVEAANANGVFSGCVGNGYHSLTQLLVARPRFVWTEQRDWAPFFARLFSPLEAKEAKPVPVATVGALVLDLKGRVLLVLTHKWGLSYGIPGGKIDKGENAREAVIRELREETGLRIQPGELFLCQDCIDSDEFYVPGSHFLLLNYVAKLKRPQTVTLNDEAVSYLWIDPHEALKLHLNLPTRVLIEAYLKAAR